MEIISDTPPLEQHIEDIFTFLYMGRGRSGFIRQGPKKFDQKMIYRGGSIFIKPALEKKAVPTVPSTLVDLLKKMDPKTVTEILLKPD